ncbi:hypothetical protein BD310DRAFT_936881 [Dichomitus squalens]|uniref:Secreted protein n=1 Tax=Dichomitus squalens TaxID=114155 RepID=A0A4Q9PIT4_9APHY|nr:hypothetical protein BD310DRAFT_936881 [Dichomitus squalens]
MNYRTLLIVNSFYIAITLPSVSSVGKPVRILDIVFSQTSLGGGRVRSPFIMPNISLNVGWLRKTAPQLVLLWERT